MKKLCFLMALLTVLLCSCLPGDFQVSILQTTDETTAENTTPEATESENTTSEETTPEETTPEKTTPEVTTPEETTPEEILLTTPGLAYEVNYDGKTCTITGIGICTESDIVIGNYIDKGR